MSEARATAQTAASEVAHSESGKESSPENQAQGSFGPEFALSGDLRRVMAGPQSFTPATIMRLQRTIGNRSVQRLLQGHRPQTAATVSNVVQRAGGAHPTYTSQAGQTWKAIATLHGFFATTLTSGMQSFMATNNIDMGKMDDVVATGTTVKLPRGTTPVATTSTTTSTTGTTGTTGGTTSTTTTSGPPPVPNQAELGTVLSAIGKYLDWVVSKPGLKLGFEFGFRVPVSGGIFLGLKLSGEAEREKPASGSTGPGLLKLDSKLGIEGKASYTFLYYGQVDFGASLVRNIKAESTRGGTGAMEALSFGLYRSVQETSYIPGRILNWIWGSDRESWSAATAGRMAATDDKVFVGTAVAGAVSGTVNTNKDGGGGNKLGVEAVVTTGTEYSKDSIENQGTDDGSGGFKGTMTRGWLGGSYESSLGESKTTKEFSVKLEIMGTEASFKLAREGTEWGAELSLSVGTLSKLDGDSLPDKAAKLWETVKTALGLAGSKMPEQLKLLASAAGMSKKALRSANQVAGLIGSGVPPKDQFALVVYQGIKGPESTGGGGSSPSTGLVPHTGGGSTALTTGSSSMSTALVPYEPPKTGTWNVDEGKVDGDVKFTVGIKANLTKKEVEFGLDIGGELGFDSSAITAKGSVSYSIYKWKKP